MKVLIAVVAFLSLSIFSASNITIIPTLPSASIPQYSNYALILFAIGIILFVVMILHIFGETPLPREGIVGAVTNFTLAYLAVICLLWSGFYQSTAAIQPYNITTPAGRIAVSATNATSTSLATNLLAGSLIYAFSICAAIIGGVSLLSALILYADTRKERKRKRGNS